MAKAEVKGIIRQLKKKEIRVIDVPKEYENDIQIVAFERKSGLRITGKRGFDIISNSFFVEEDLIYVDINGQKQKRSVFLSFDNFDLYFDFLNSDIYDNACYTFCRLSEDTIASRKIDLKKLMERKALTEDTIDDYSLSVSNEEKDCYKNAEQIHKHCQQWVKKFNNCRSYDELVKVVSNYSKSKIAPIVDVSFFFFQYIFADIEDKQRFAIIMEYMSSDAYPEYAIINGLCSIYNPDDVMQSLNYSLGDKRTIKKHKRKLKEYIRYLKDGEIKFYLKGFFDKKTHYYCEEIRGNGLATIRRYFDTFDEFADYRNGDLTHCDLSDALECDVDFSKYIVDETTKLPIHTNMEVTYSVKKYYHNEKFYVTQQWCNTSGNVIKEYPHSFRYFFDFVAFLKGDLSGADLILCDGLAFLEQWNSIDFTNAKMKSALYEKFGLEYDSYEIKTNFIESFEYVEQNENETTLVLQSSRDLTTEAVKRDLQRVHYVSDIHLMHKIQNAECRSKEDVIYVIQKIVSTIAHEADSLLLIDGDVASDFDIFQLFVKMLSKTLHRNIMVVFTLGNHELWSFPDFSINKIVSKYRTLLDEYGMYLIHNDVLYKEDHSLRDSNTGTHLIKYDELCEMDDTQISERLRNARYVILGGLGFSGYNMEFNADNGIYRGTVDRATEIKESKKFEDLYNRLHCILINKNAIILTHTPKKDWCSETRHEKNFVYVSGHTHRNFFHDDAEYRVYSDNQVGYHNNSPHLKTFLIDNDYDCFSDYDDGIFEITGEQYNDFYRGKNISMIFQREVNVLYMLKKNGYYCFICQSKGGSLAILNGGAIKKLGVQNVQYYYDNMDAMISTIKTPLDKFVAFQRHIADMVKRIDGVGTIHGSIIDINFYNHIYVNPIDLSVTGYWASDIINKIVYPSIPALLEKKCPEIFGKYVKLLEGSRENPFALKQQTDIALLPQVYLDTDIYKASREIKKMQKLSSNILSSWYEEALSKKPQIELFAKKP
ncbi:MAG: metallophosphoesterase [Clostridium sp.]|jgi:hypothetical protein|nr:metallophosphoesterase [Clostridium sp.]